MRLTLTLILILAWGVQAEAQPRAVRAFLAASRVDSTLADSVGAPILGGKLRYVLFANSRDTVEVWVRGNGSLDMMHGFYLGWFYLGFAGRYWGRASIRTYHRYTDVQYRQTHDAVILRRRHLLPASLPARISFGADF